MAFTDSPTQDAELRAALAAYPAAALPHVLILAAGRGERFLASGGASHKLQAEVAPGISVLQATLAAVQASGLPWHLERGPHPGMGDSIAAAVKATPDAHGWLILPADLPLIAPASLQTIALTLLGHRPAGAVEDVEAQGQCRQASLMEGDATGLRVVQPQWQGQSGHPVAFSKAAFASLIQLAGDKGAASIVRQAAQQSSLMQIALQDEGTVLDVDTVPLLERARQLWLQRSART